MNNKIKKIQNFLVNFKYDFILITNNDLHLNESPNLLCKDIFNLCGFDCSNGYLIIFKNEISFFTDSRYLLAANKFFKKNVKVYDLQKYPITEFLLKINSSSVGIVDPKLISANMFVSLNKILFKKNIKLIPHKKLPYKKNYYPDFKYSYAFSLPSSIVARPFRDNLNLIKKKLNSDGALIWNNSHVAYLLNLRSFELDNSTKPFAGLFIFKKSEKPVLITKNSSLININKIKKNFKVLNQSKFIDYIFSKKLTSISSDLNEINFEIYKKISKRIKILQTKVDIDLLKSKKTNIEIKNIKFCHGEDAISMIKFIFLIKNKLIDLKSEFHLSNLLYQIRKEGVNFFRNSFDYISAFDENAAIVHYKPTEKKSKKFVNNKILLIDSGAHYLEGTTDITRVISLDRNISKNIKKKYTLILKSLIRLENYQFKRDITGSDIDNFVRGYLSNNGINYGHSTGHGVGYFNDVHEKYPVISKKFTKKIFNNNLFSIEPGCYFPNKYGLRIENLYISKIKNSVCTLENITLVPYDTDLIDWSLLNKKEISYINKFHLRLINIYSDRLSENIVEYLKGSLIY